MLHSVQLCILFLSVCPSIYLFFQLLSCYQLRLALISQFSCLLCLLMLGVKSWTTTLVFSFYSLPYKLLLDSFSFQFIPMGKHTVGMESLYTLGIVLSANLPSFRIFFFWGYSHKVSKQTKMLEKLVQLKNQRSGLKARNCKRSKDLFAGTEYITHIQKRVHVCTHRHLCIYFIFNFWLSYSFS